MVICVLRLRWHSYGDTFGLTSQLEVQVGSVGGSSDKSAGAFLLIKLAVVGTGSITAGSDVGPLHALLLIHASTTSRRLYQSHQMYEELFHAPSVHS